MKVNGKNFFKKQSLVIISLILLSARAQTDTGQDTLLGRADNIKPTEAEWTILTYLQADNNLAQFALPNLEELSLIKAGSAVNILAQWHPTGNQQALRYKVNYGKIEQQSIAISPQIKSPDKDLIDAMEWAVTNYPAKKYMLVFWSHGNGIIDQNFYYRSLFKLDPITTVLPAMPWLEVPGLTIQQSQKDFRGILYSESTQSYMNNQQLSNALSTIKEKILGKKIDIIGMDACFMSMLEVGYQIKNYADILVAAQNSEPGRGWYYEGVAQALSANPAITPEDLSRTIVLQLEDLYGGLVTFYTQSAINLKAIDPIVENLNSILTSFAQCKKLNPEKTIRACRLAHALSTRFDFQAYLDLHSFYRQLGGSLSAQKKSKLKKTVRSNYEIQVKKLCEELALGMTLIENAVFANVTGSKVKQARGLSIYFPLDTIHQSYLKTDFAQESKWLSFLKMDIHSLKKRNRL